MAEMDALLPLRRRLQDHMRARGLDAGTLARRTDRISRSTVYSAIGGDHVPRDETIDAIARAMRLSAEQRYELLDLRGLAEARQTRLAGDGILLPPPAADVVRGRFDGTAGRSREELTWHYIVGAGPEADRVVEIRRTYVGGRTPLEAVGFGPGQHGESMIESIGQLGLRATVVEAPAPVQVSLLALSMTPWQLELLALFTPPVTARGWVTWRVGYRWPGLWQSLRTSEGVSSGRLGFGAYTTLGSVQVTAPFDADYYRDEPRGFTEKTVDAAGRRRLRWSSPDPGEVTFKVVRVTQGTGARHDPSICT